MPSSKWKGVVEGCSIVTQKLGAGHMFILLEDTRMRPAWLAYKHGSSTSQPQGSTPPIVRSRHGGVGGPRYQVNIPSRWCPNSLIRTSQPSRLLSDIGHSVLTSKSLPPDGNTPRLGGLLCARADMRRVTPSEAGDSHQASRVNPQHQVGRRCM